MLDRQCPDSRLHQLLSKRKDRRVVILSLALISFLLLLAKQYRGLWFTGPLSFAVLLFTFINLQIRISEIKDKLGVELAGNRPPGLADLAVRSVQIEWGWSVLTIGAAFIVWAAANKFVSVAREAAYQRTRTSDPKPLFSDPSVMTLRYSPTCARSVIRFRRSDVAGCPKCGADNPHRTRLFSHSATREDPDEYRSAIKELNCLIGLSTVKHEIETLANLVRVQKMREAHGLNVPTMSLHLVFTGNPGYRKNNLSPDCLAASIKDSAF